MYGLSAVTAGSFELSVSIGFGDVAGLASGVIPSLAVNGFTGCLTISGNNICAKYAGFIGGPDGFGITTCDIDIGTQDCACVICDDNASIKFNCAPDFPALTSNGVCVSPALIG